jgi:predicted HTH transcriptional regulator
MAYWHALPENWEKMSYKEFLEARRSLIAGFLNSPKGGTLIVGVADKGETLGLDSDGFDNEDKMDLHFGNIIKSRLGAASMLHILPHFEDLQNKRVLVVDCNPSNIPIYLKQGNTEEFYVRAGASSASLSPSQMNDYIK